MTKARPIYPLVAFAAAMLVTLIPGSFNHEPASHASANEARARLAISRSFGAIPLHFEPDRDPSKTAAYTARGPGYAVAIGRSEISVSVRAAVVRLALHGASRASAPEGRDTLPGTVNYLLGNDPAKWRTNVPTFASLQQNDVYPGIDVVHYGNQRQLEYDFVVAPGADPKRIAVGVAGADSVVLEHNGDLLLHTPGGVLRQHKPIAYQQTDGERREVTAKYSLVAPNESGQPAHVIRFVLGEYNAAQPLIIDPVLSYSTFLGGSRADAGTAIAVDALGNAYIAGHTTSSDFPVSGPGPGSSPGTQDAFVVKLNPSGSAIVYATYFGGSGVDYVDGRGGAIEVDEAGQVYVTGTTTSADFPVQQALQPVIGGSTDAFIMKLSADGSTALYATFIGGSADDYSEGLAIDGTGAVYATGYTSSTDFPTVNALQPAHHAGFYDAYVVKVNAAGSALVYSTYIGGGGEEYGFGIAVDAGGNAYVTGITGSGDFPTVGPFQAAHGGQYDAYVTKLNASGSALVYSTFLGGNGYDFGLAITVDPTGHAYVTGIAVSDNFPTANPIQAEHGSYEFWRDDAFISKLTPDGTGLVYSTYLGGSGGDFGYGVVVDDDGNAYIAGGTFSRDFPTVDPLQPVLGGVHDGFVAKLTASGTALVYSTYLGGAADDYVIGLARSQSGAVYIAGVTSSGDFPTAHALQSAYGSGASDAFVAKLNDAAPTVCEMIGAVVASVSDADLSAGLRNSLVAKLNAACAAYDRGNIDAAIRQLVAVQQEVAAQAGKAFFATTAAAIIAAIQLIVDGLA